MQLIVAINVLEVLLRTKESNLGELAQQCETETYAVLEAIEYLSGQGLDISVGSSVKLSLPDSIILLDQNKIWSFIKPSVGNRIDNLELSYVTPSTNSLALAHKSVDKFNFFLTEHQVSGKGRRGRSWVSKFGDNLLMSAACRVPRPLHQVSVLSLWSAVACYNAIKSLGVREIGIKWPNDIYVNGKKVAGILLEAKQSTEGYTHLAVGMGINCNQLDKNVFIGQPWISLREAIGGYVDRNFLAAAVIEELVNCFTVAFSKPDRLIELWHDRDIYLGQNVCVLAGDDGEISGVHQGITPEGLLILGTDTGEHYYNAGEVSLRGR
ncbi:biotin--[acetyl-CoA-carboxylase] ligase [Gynuella sunshinyii]|uniref:biotin--[acetyl-CoA-carboxylase] ligase n=1 Tax=Gynuella sunshinyii TaxID=1445505 RepID=UPI0005CC032C|nr:biotin--[acetyl-CoA-carboxylase] ligase [Gynuella sunshinyii]